MTVREIAQENPIELPERGTIALSICIVFLTLLIVGLQSHYALLIWLFDGTIALFANFACCLYRLGYSQNIPVGAAIPHPTLAAGDRPGAWISQFSCSGMRSRRLDWRRASPCIAADTCHMRIHWPEYPFTNSIGRNGHARGRQFWKIQVVVTVARSICSHGYDRSNHTSGVPLAGIGIRL